MRFLSWVVFCFLLNAFYYVNTWFWRLFYYVFNLIKDLNEILFWVLVVLEGTTALSLIFALVILCAQYIVKASYAIHRSAKGTRAIVAGVIYIVFYAAALFLLIFCPDAFSGPMFVWYASVITMIVFSIFVIRCGKSDSYLEVAKREFMAMPIGDQIEAIKNAVVDTKYRE